MLVYRCFFSIDIDADINTKRISLQYKSDHYFDARIPKYNILGTKNVQMKYTS